MSSAYTLSEVTAGSKKDAHLIHGVDSTGNPLCNRVKADNLTGYAPAEHTKPTCAHCLKRWK